MLIDLRDTSRRRIGRVVVDPTAHPTRVAVPGTEREAFLDWDSALDDAGRLRRCVSCGCKDLFQEKAFPQITGFVVVVAFAAAVFGLLGRVSNAMLIGMTGILLIDVGILILARRRLVCYRCRTTYRDLDIARYHRGWDRPTAERHPAPAPDDETPPAPAASKRVTT